MKSERELRSPFLGIALVAMGVISYEIILMRLFSIESYAAFGYMIISIALMGFGVSGTLITLYQTFFRRNLDWMLYISSLLVLPAVALAWRISLAIPFVPPNIIQDTRQVTYVAYYYLTLFVPFFFASFFIGLILVGYAKQVNKLYAFDLAGSGIGALLALGAMFVVHPKYLLLIVLDVSDPAARLQYDTVVSTLEEIFADVRRRHPKDAPPFREPECVLLLNKADRLRDNAPLLMWERETPGAIPFCALEEGGLGHEALIRLVLDRARGEIRTLRLTLPLSDAKAIDVIEKRTDVTEREYHDGRVTLTTSIGSRQIQQIRASGARLVVEGESAEEVKAW